mmetsp:Transcript_28708/g.77285  ORF Transcript_28708/g.77285 Transcript_28708/m.77285 type:complete len:200 (+) Transcript_28708:2467-3066(+)
MSPTVIRAVPDVKILIPTRTTVRYSCIFSSFRSSSNCSTICCAVRAASSELCKLRIGESGGSPSARKEGRFENPFGEGEDGERTKGLSEFVRRTLMLLSDEGLASPSAPTNFRIGDGAKGAERPLVVLSGEPLISPVKLLRRLSLLVRRISLLLLPCRCSRPRPLLLPPEADWVRCMRKAGKSFTMLSSPPFLILSSSI